MSRRGDHVAINNRRARYDYELLDHWEAGVMLVGAEVKSIRLGHANLQDAYARIEDGEAWLFGMHILAYKFSSGELDPVRRRKLLLYAREIDEMARRTQQRGLTLIPTRVYFKDGRVKVEIALGRGKRTYDKRRAIAARDARRETERALKGERD